MTKRAVLAVATYFENRCKELDIKLLALVEHAMAIHVQKERCSMIFEQERAHREIYQEDHDKQWPLSKAMLDTYLLVRIFGMFKHTKEIAERGEDVDYANFKFFARANQRKE